MRDVPRQPPASTVFIFCHMPFAVCLLVLSQLLSPRASAAGPEIVGASSESHLWFVVEEQRTGRTQLPRLYRLLHHADAMPGPMVSSESTLPALSQHPEAMAAWENQLWLVNAAQPNVDDPRREVFSLRVRYEPTFEVYQHEPLERLLSEPPLPAEGRLADFVALASGPVALLVPTERGVSDVVTADGTAPRDSELSRPRLLQLSNGNWDEIPLPEGIEPGADLRLGMSPAGDGVLYLFSAHIVPGRDSSPSTVLYRRHRDTWQQSQLALDLSRIRHFTHALGQCVAILEDREQHRATAAIVRPNDVLEIASFETSEAPWTVLGLKSDLRLVTRGAPPQIFMQHIDPLTGELSERAQLQAIRPITISLVHLPILLVLSIAAVLIAFALGRRHESAPIELPEGWALLGPMGRLMTLAIDLVPAGLVTMFLLRCEFSQLLQPPIFVSRLDASVPYLVMAGLTILHTGLWELTTGSSLGKSLLHAKVTDLRGERLTVPATLIRIAFKAIVLYVPLLAIFNLMNSRGQGLGDRAVGTLVIAEEEQPQEA